MGKQENSTKSKGHAEYMKARGIRRTTGQCPWGCGGSYSIGDGSSLMNHLNSCQGGGAKKRNRLTNAVSRLRKRSKR